MAEGTDQEQDSKAEGMDPKVLIAKPYALCIAQRPKMLRQMEWKHLVVQRTKINENKEGQRQNN